jgi:nicotinate phosphoribosyltransferase
LNCSEITVTGFTDGTICFPKEPLLRIEGPIGVLQIVETAILNLINFPSLIATNASRMKNKAGPDVSCSEFGLRRAQGPNGGMMASKYSMLGGFDSSSNVYAGYLFNIPIIGTHAHSYVTSFTSEEDIALTRTVDGTDIFKASMVYREQLGY